MKGHTIVLSLRRLEKENREFESTLGYMNPTIQREY